MWLKVNVRKNEDTRMLVGAILFSIFSTLNRSSYEVLLVVLFMPLLDLLSGCCSFLSGISYFFLKFGTMFKCSKLKKAVNWKNTAVVHCALNMFLRFSYFLHEVSWLRKSKILFIYCPAKLVGNRFIFVWKSCGC